MTFDLQRANVWKRISAFLFDVILLAIACVLCAWGLSALLGFDAQYQTLMARYQAAADACGLDMSIMTQTYSALTDAQRALVEQANAVLAADETAVHAVETMIPIMAVMMLFFGNLNIVVLGIVLILSVAQFVLFLATRKHSLIHDLLADTVAVDMASQMIFNSTDELVAYKAKLQAEKVAHQMY